MARRAVGSTLVVVQTWKKEDQMNKMADQSTVRTSRTRRWALRTTLASMLLAVVLPGAAGAAGTGALVVRGIQLAYGTCGVNSDGYEMTGDLVGCWWITDFQPQIPQGDDSKHNLRATGTELFVGWIGSRYGSFETDFQYTAKFDGSWTSFIEIHGRCHHPIKAGTGTGDFVGITGELSFTDVVDVNPPYYPYWGSVRIAGQTLTLGALSQKASTSSSDTAAPAPSC
jgi:hypothetical protein